MSQIDGVRYDIDPIPFLARDGITSLSMGDEITTRSNNPYALASQYAIFFHSTQEKRRRRGVRIILRRLASNIERQSTASKTMGTFPKNVLEHERRLQVLGMDEVNFSSADFLMHAAVVPMIPGIPLLLAGGLILAPKYPFMRTSVRRFRRWAVEARRTWEGFRGEAARR
jgi:hypothetical protein